MSLGRVKAESELVLRGLAILLVVGVHFLAGLPSSVYTTSSWQPLVVFLDQLSRVSVPIFVAMSGFGLTLKYQKRIFSWSEFLHKRVWALLPLYLLWSLICYLVFLLVPAWGPYGAPESFLWQLVLGRADYQMYFVPMIFQLYLLFPFLLPLFKKSPWLVLGAALVIQLGLLHWYGLITGQRETTMLFRNDQQQYVFGLSWIFYFALGMFIAEKKKWLRSRQVIGWVALLLSLGTLGWLSVMGMQQINSGVDPIVALRFTRWPVMLYAGSALVFLLVFPRATGDLPGGLKRKIEFFGRHAYSIYLSHTLLLRLIFTLLGAVGVV